MAAQEERDPGAQLKRLQGGIREVAHDISNPLGVLRMAIYYLQHGKPDKAKQDHYYMVISETVDKVEAGLNRLRALSDNPMVEIRGDEASGQSEK